MDSRISEMLARHYRDEWGNCAHCTAAADWELESLGWPCDTAYLLMQMGHTLRETPPRTYESPDPTAPSRSVGSFIPEIWHTEFVDYVHYVQGKVHE